MDRLVSCNVGLVVKIASGCIRRIGIRSSSVSFDGVVSAGMEGLIVGINRFGVSKGTLSTYAYWWVKNYVRRVLVTNMPFGTVSIRTAEGPSSTAILPCLKFR